MKCRRLLGIAGGLLMAVFGPTIEPSAQLLGVGDEIRADCSSVAQGDVRESTITIVCGMPHADVVELVRLAASPEAGDRQTLIARLDALVPADSRFRVEAIARFFEILGEAPVESEKLADRFAQVAGEHVRLLEEIRRFRVRDPEGRRSRTRRLRLSRSPTTIGHGPSSRRRASSCVRSGRRRSSCWLSRRARKQRW